MANFTTSRKGRIEEIRAWLRSEGVLDAYLTEHGPIEQWDQRFIDNIYEDEMNMYPNDDDGELFPEDYPEDALDAQPFDAMKHK